MVLAKLPLLATSRIGGRAAGGDGFFSRKVSAVFSVWGIPLDLRVGVPKEDIVRYPPHVCMSRRFASALGALFERWSPLPKMGVSEVFALIQTVILKSKLAIISARAHRADDIDPPIASVSCEVAGLLHQLSAETEMLCARAAFV